MIPPDKREEWIICQARERPAAERAVFLDGACAGDAALRERLERLLVPHDQPEEVLADGIDAATVKATIKLDLADAPDEAVGQTLGRYKLLERVGEGGCGVVYVAEQTEPVRRRVALKVIKLGMDTKQVVARFEAERQALAMMDHPNIAKVLDAGTTDVGPPYFVMELVRGIKITEYCDQANLTTKERLDLFIKVCQAIQHAHQKGIIHRDIKPSNILVTLHDALPVPKVIDFGIAKATEGRLTDNTVYTQLHQFIGTPAYMSPEQAEMSGLDIDTRSDIYSLGVLLYELLAGSTPFDARELMSQGIDAMRKTIREKEPPRPSTRLTQELVAVDVSPRKSTFGLTVPTQEEVSADSRRRLRLKEQIHCVRGDLDWIVMKCLEKDRTRRYETANGLAFDLKRHLNNEPVLARPPSRLYEFHKTVRRHKFGFAAAGALIIVLAAGVLTSTWEAFAARKAQRATELARRGEEIQRHEAQQKQAEAETERQRAVTEQQRADAQAKKASESKEQSQRLLYASDMNLAQQALKLNNLGKARRLLDRHRPQPGEEDLRGWEWRYLWQLTRSSALATLTNRQVRGMDVNFSPDGTRLAVGWDDGRVDLWDVAGRRFVRALTGHSVSGQVGHVAFSPVRNLLVATSGPKVVTIHDFDSGQESIFWRGPDRGDWIVRNLSFSQDGSKVVIYAGAAADFGDAVWVVNASSAQVESHHPATYSNGDGLLGAAQLSPDNRRLYLTCSNPADSRYSIQCIDLAIGKELWQTEPQRDRGATALALSPDGRVLASGSGYEDPTIRIWDAEIGRLRVRLDGHTGWVGKLVFSKDGRRLISAASDQTIRIWDTSTWVETKVLRGNTDEVHAVAISETAQLLASASKSGDIMLWKENDRSAADGYRRLPDELVETQVLPLDHSRVLLLPAGKPPELVDLKSDGPPAPLPEIGSSANVLGCYRTNIICHWNGTSQILVSELRGAKLIQCGATTLDSGTRPTAFAYNATRQLLAWAEPSSATSIFMTSLASPGRHVELKSGVTGLVPFRFSEDGNYLAAATERQDALRVWNVETGQIVASVDGGHFRDAAFAEGGRVLVVSNDKGNGHEICFYDLVHPDQPPRRVPGREVASVLALSPNGGLVAASTLGGLVLLFDPAKGELIESVHGHLNSVFGIVFSPDERRLVSGSGGREAVKLWDVSTRQELLTLGGIGSRLQAARWSADGDVILAGPPWQAWRAPSWEEIAAAEAKEKAEGKKP